MDEHASVRAAMPRRLRQAAAAARGFMPEPEGMALYEAARERAASGPVVEVGTYCGKSSIYLGAGVKEAGSVLVTVDHHRGSEEHQPGEGHHDPDLVDTGTGRVDTLPHARAALESAGLEDWVVAVAGRSATVAALWATPLSLLFIDGGHTDEAAAADYTGWAPHVMEGGWLAIHDVFPGPRGGGQAPYRIYRRAVDGGGFVETRAVGSLRLLRRAGAGTRASRYRPPRV